MSPEDRKRTGPDDEAEVASEVRRLFVDVDVDDDANQRFEVLFASRQEGLSGAKVSEVLERLEGGSYIAIVHRIERETIVGRLLTFLALPLRLLASERALRLALVSPRGRYALAPSVRSAWLVYELRSPAARYAELELLAGMTRRGLMGFLQQGVSLWTGCSPSVGSVVVLGRKE